MKKWHDHKINKYLPFNSAKESRGLEIEIYAGEVGAIYMHHVIPLRKASKILQSFNLQLSW